MTMCTESQFYPFLDKCLYLVSFSLNKGFSKNTTEYEVGITGFEWCYKYEILIATLTIYSDFELIVEQPRGEYNLTKVKPIPYGSRSEKRVTQFEVVEITYIRRATDEKENTLARLEHPTSF